jgi:hypothetical protein
VLVVAPSAIWAAALHGIEGMIGVAGYPFFGAMPEYPHATLYSPGAETACSHLDLHLARHTIHGRLEALNGMLLGLTTAFLFGTIQSVPALHSKRPL